MVSYDVVKLNTLASVHRVKVVQNAYLMIFKRQPVQSEIDGWAHFLLNGGNLAFLLDELKQSVGPDQWPSLDVSGNIKARKKLDLKVSQMLSPSALAFYKKTKNTD